MLLSVLNHQYSVLASCQGVSKTHLLGFRQTVIEICHCYVVKVIVLPVHNWTFPEWKNFLLETDDQTEQICMLNTCICGVQPIPM